MVLLNRLGQTSAEGPLLIPNDVCDIQLRLCAIARPSAAGHSGVKSKTMLLSDSFHWNSLDDDADLFLKECVHCITSAIENELRHPHGLVLHVIAPNDLIQHNHLDLGLSPTDERYFLIIRRDYYEY